MEDRNGEGDGSFFRMFKRKKKTKLYLLHSLKQLSLTIEEQVAVIKALTEQHKQCQDVRHLQDTIISLTTELQRAKDQNAALQEKLEATLSQLMTAEQDIESRKEREREFDEVNDELSSNLRQVERNVGELQTQVAVYHERLKYAEEQNQTLRKSSDKFETEIEVTKSEYAKVHLKSRLLEQEAAHKTEIIETGKSARLDLERELGGLRETLVQERARAYESELNLDAENECLKFEVTSLSKKMKKMTEEVNNLQNEKLLIMSYYTRLMSENALFSKPTIAIPSNHMTTRAFTIDTNGGRLILNKAQIEDELHPEALENITLKNKLTSMENRLFRKEQLIEELVTMIQERDKDFNIQHHPSLNIYLDAKSP